MLLRKMRTVHGTPPQGSSGVMHLSLEAGAEGVESLKAEDLGVKVVGVRASFLVPWPNVAWVEPLPASVQPDADASASPGTPHKVEAPPPTLSEGDDPFKRAAKLVKSKAAK